MGFLLDMDLTPLHGVTFSGLGSWLRFAGEAVSTVWRADQRPINGLRFRVWGLGFGVQVSGFRV